jgi:uncharacterized metal-binding protein
MVSIVKPTSLAGSRAANARTWWVLMVAGLAPHSSQRPRRTRRMISLCGCAGRCGQVCERVVRRRLRAMLGFLTQVGDALGRAIVCP